MNETILTVALAIVFLSLFALIINVGLDVLWEYQMWQYHKQVNVEFSIFCKENMNSTNREVNLYCGVLA